MPSLSKPQPDPRSRPSLWAQVIPLMGSTIIEAISCIRHAMGMDLPHELESGLAAASGLLALVSLYILLRGFREASLDRSVVPPQPQSSIPLEGEVAQASPLMEEQGQSRMVDAWTAWRRGISIQSVDSAGPDSLAICMENMTI